MTSPASPERLPLTSPDLAAERLARLRELLPGAFAEGKLVPEKLAELVGVAALSATPERYGLSYAGRAEALREMLAPSPGTLRPERDKSVAWDATENLIIEGDNLHVLKLLQSAYAGAVKLIYIDPPYNTGNDFVYPDDFRAGVKHYKELTRQALSTNAETSGRYHSDWLKMMHPRLALARNLLRDDGVIFVSIDDHEVHNLRLLMDEVFGEENFVAQVIWKKRSTPPNDKILGANHDYILCYALKAESVGLNLRERTEEQEARYKNPDNHRKGPWAPGDLMANVKGGRYVESLYFPIRNPNTGEDHFPGKDGNWRFNREKIERLIANDEISFGEDGKGRPKLKRFLCEVKEGTTYPTIWDFVPFNTEGSAEMTEIFGSLTTFENPKPAGLLSEIVKCAAGPSDLILDFFAGSGTTGQAVLELNRQDGGNRKFILVQFPEPTGRADFPTIADITRERVRRVIKKLNTEDAESTEKQEGQLPLPADSAISALKKSVPGFRAYRLVHGRPPGGHARCGTRGAGAALGADRGPVGQRELPGFPARALEQPARVGAAGGPVQDDPGGDSRARPGLRSAAGDGGGCRGLRRAIPS